MYINLFYTENGKENGGVPMILLHGNGGNSSSFFYVTYHFAKTRWVINLDTRGHGCSPKGEGAFTLDRFADDLKEFMDDLGIEKADLVGYSDGGNIAMIFAMRYPDRVNSMVLNGANMFPDGLEKKDLKWILKSYNKAKRALRRNPQNEKARQTYDLMALMVHEPTISPDELEEIDVPTLVLVGSHDAIKPEHSQLIADSIKGARLTVVSGGHNIVKSNPLEYIAAIEEFYKAAP
jgi:pimeloyl-ACP methyl ester carboxylesterase